MFHGTTRHSLRADGALSNTFHPKTCPGSPPGVTCWKHLTREVVHANKVPEPEPPHLPPLSPNHIHAHTHTLNLEFPVGLTCITLELGGHSRTRVKTNNCQAASSLIRGQLSGHMTQVSN